jgi:hypothetical protein
MVTGLPSIVPGMVRTPSGLSVKPVIVTVPSETVYLKMLRHSVMRKTIWNYLPKEKKM